MSLGNTDVFDIIIVGAGPSGTSTALTLKEAGFKVALIDKSNFPRRKTCGDAIPGPTFHYLKKVYPSVLEDFIALSPHHEIKSSKIYTVKNKTIDVNWKSYAYNSSRESFDNFLLDLVKKYTDTTLFLGSSVGSIERKEDSFVLTLKSNKQLKAKMLVACDGSNSIVQKTLHDFEGKIPSKAVALSTYYKGLQTDSSSNEFYLFKKIPGYFWIFPVENGWYNVGYGLFKSNADQSAALRENFQKILSTHPVIREKLSGAEEVSSIKGFHLPLGGTKKPISGDGYLLVGDAAYLVDPIGGHGIDKGVFSGIKAAEHLIKHYKGNQLTKYQNKSYDDIISSSIGKELRRNYKIANVFSNFPSMLDWFYPFISKKA